MKAVIEGISSDEVKISVDGRLRKLYGVSPYSVKEGLEIEYEIVTNEGSSYPRYVGPAYSEDKCITVSQLDKKIDELLRNNSGLRKVWVKGELSDDPAFKDYCFFTLKEVTHEYGKDHTWIISCIVDKKCVARVVDFRLKQGQKLAVYGDIKGFGGRSLYQLDVLKIVDIGEGEARLEYEQRKERLRSEGYFDQADHDKVPDHAERIGILTAESGDAIKDILKVQRELNPYVQMVLYNVNVQGANAVKSNVEGIRRLDNENLDVIIIGRGGGSNEDLSVYDNEDLVKAVYYAHTPIVSAVGHERHEPLIDLAADARYSNPSDAAHHVIFDVNGLINDIEEKYRRISEKTAGIVRDRTYKLRLAQAALEKNSPKMWIDRRLGRLETLKVMLDKNGPETKIRERRSRLGILTAVMEKNSPERRLEERRNRLAQECRNMSNLMNNIFTAKKAKCALLIKELEGLSPYAKLVGGFGYISVDNRPVTGIEGISVGDTVSVMIHDGEITAKVVELVKKGS